MTLFSVSSMKHSLTLKASERQCITQSFFDFRDWVRDNDLKIL